MPWLCCLPAVRVKYCVSLVLSPVPQTWRRQWVLCCTSVLLWVGLRLRVGKLEIQSKYSGMEKDKSHNNKDLDSQSVCKGAKVTLGQSSHLQCLYCPIQMMKRLMYIPLSTTQIILFLLICFPTLTCCFWCVSKCLWWRGKFKFYFFNHTDDLMIYSLYLNVCIYRTGERTLFFHWMSVCSFLLSKQIKHSAGVFLIEE